MRKKYALICLFLIALNAKSQVQIIWSEDFNNGCTVNCNANSYVGPNGAWVVADVTPPGNVANEWFVSCAENGEAVGACGAGCGSNATLHIANVPCNLCLVCPNGDCGAAYNAGPTIGGENPTSDKRAYSPLINTTGYSNINLSFKYIERGRNTTDDAMVEYSIDGGLTWTLLYNTAKTVNCGSGQGTWTAYTDTLPASCNNNASLMIGFHWKNNSDGLGTDPSFAVDDVILSVNATGTETLGNNKSISLSFNTGNDILYISTNNTFEKVSFLLADASGKIAGNDNFILSSNSKSYTFDTSGLASGIYIVKVISDKLSFVKKIFID